jgi:hypothetical protein
MITLTQQYDRSLRYARGKKVLHSPACTSHWSAENISFYEAYKNWLLGGGTCEYSAKTIYLPMAGHVLGLNLKPHHELNLDSDLQKAIDYITAKDISQDWMKACKNGLNIFRRYLRLTRGLGEENKQTPFDPNTNASDLPAWLVAELTHYQRLQQRNWRTARIEENIRRFWSGYLRMFRFFKIKEINELKRKQIFAYIDHRLSTGHSVTGINADLRYLHTFLLFLQDEGHLIPQTLLRIPGLKAT